MPCSLGAIAMGAGIIGLSGAAACWPLLLLLAPECELPSAAVPNAARAAGVVVCVFMVSPESGHATLSQRCEIESSKVCG